MKNKFNFTQVAWRAVSQIIIFFYLLVEETSVLIVLPSGVSIIIEVSIYQIFTKKFEKKILKSLKLLIQVVET